MRPPDAAGPFGIPPSGGAVPRGLICLWSGSVQDIPRGWLLCDGTDGTPNLLDRFVKGISSATATPGTTGGAATHYHAVSGTHSHEVPWNNTPSSMAARSTASFATGNSVAGVQKPSSNNSDTTNAARQKTQAVSSGNTNAANGEPPYFTIAYIMKS